MTEDKNPGKGPGEIAQILGVPSMETHLFLCTGPDCCAPEMGAEAWQRLKAKIKEVCPNLSEAKIYRTKVDCLRICKEGPIAVAYPQGRWFQGVTPERIPEIVEHLASGTEEKHPLEFARHPLPAPPAKT